MYPGRGTGRRSAASVILGIALVTGAWSALGIVAGAGSAGAAPSPSPTAVPVRSSWPSLQGGPAHTGSISGSPLRPPLAVAWRASPVAGPASPVVTASVGGVLEGFQVGAASVAAFDVATGATLWSVARPGGPAAAPAVVPEAGPNGTLVYAQGTGDRSGLVGLDLATGRPLWRTRLPAPTAAGLSAWGGEVYASAGSRVYALDASTGAVRWTRTAQGTVADAPAVAAGRVFAIAFDASRRSDRLYAFDASTGRTDWTLGSGAVVRAVTGPSVSDGTVVAGFGDGFVRAVSAASGRIVWQGSATLGFDPRSTPAVAGGTAYALDVTGGLYAYRLRSGAAAWDFRFAASGGAGAPLVAGRFCYVGLADGTVQTLDVRSGDLVGTVRVGRGAVGALAPAGSLLLAPLVAGGVVALRHDPAGTLLNVVSPSRLFLGTALLRYGIVGLLLFAAFAAASRRIRPPDDLGVSLPGAGRAAGSAADDGRPAR